MPRYSDKQKAAYYKRKYKQSQKSRYIKGRGHYNYPYIRGQGHYKLPKGTFKKWGTMSGKALGAMSPVAPGIFSQVGGIAGGYAGSKLANIVGQGDYSIKRNSLTNPSQMVHKFGPSSIRVTHREYIADIDATTSFSNLSIPIQPGLDSSFPWLSSIAKNFEQYRINGMIFQFKSTASDAIASTTNLGLGQVIMATDYNAADAAYVNSPQMLGSMFSNSAKPSETFLHAIECDPSQQVTKAHYVRTGNPPSGTDIRLYDHGNFQIATENMPANYSGMGQLWVTYDVSFAKPVQNNQLGFDINTDMYYLESPSHIGNYWLGESRTLREHSNLGTIVDAGNIYFPYSLSSGYFMVCYTVQGTSNGALADPTITGLNCTKLTAWVDNSQDSATTANGINANRYNNITIWRLTGDNASITFSGGTLPSGTTQGDLIIQQINGEMFVDTP
jgi:hypothetical protein